MCYTTGTTGDPKGVAYSHRSIYLHALSVCAPWSMGLSENDNVSSSFPCFTPTRGHSYAGWLAGSDLLMPGQYLQAGPMCRMISECRPTLAAGVPTILSAVFHHSEAHSIDLSFLRLLFAEEQRFLAAWLKAFKPGIR